MDKNVARTVLPFVNDATHYGSFLLHVEDRIDVLRNFLEKEKDPSRVRELQGAIAELRRFYTLRDEVHAALDKGKKNG